MSAGDFKQLLKKYDLTMVSVGADFNELDSNVQRVVERARLFNAKYVMCAWIPHKGTEFGIGDIRKSIEVFNRAGKYLKTHGLTFCYHPHGYEFRPYENGTLFDELVSKTNPADVNFEMDVFWAKNGGFKWRKGDWEDYKSTVLRRKGPNGTTLSNATKSTRLGGGSVVGEGYSDGTIGETMTDLSSEAPIISEKRKAKKSKASRGDRNETAKEKKIREEKEADWEGGADDDVRAYRHERPARVGGINRDSDAQFYGTDYSETAPSVTQHTPRSHRQSSSRHASPEKRTGGRHESPYRQHPSSPQGGSRPSRYHSPSKSPGVRSVPGSYAETVDYDTQSQNTKSYDHHIPGLGSNAGGAGRANGGFRRGRSDSLDD